MSKASTGFAFVAGLTIERRSQCFYGSPQKRRKRLMQRKSRLNHIRPLIFRSLFNKARKQKPRKRNEFLPKKRSWILSDSLRAAIGLWCSYILALLGREQIAEALSQVALKEIIGVVLIYGLKALFENLSKNNSWPDKGNSTPPEDGVG